jgi:hypothetical protein
VITAGEAQLLQSAGGALGAHAHLGKAPAAAVGKDQERVLGAFAGPAVQQRTDDAVASGG